MLAHNIAHHWIWDGLESLIGLLSLAFLCMIPLYSWVMFRRKPKPPPYALPAILAVLFGIGIPLGLLFIPGFELPIALGWSTQAVWPILFVIGLFCAMDRWSRTFFLLAGTPILLIAYVLMDIRFHGFDL